MRKNRLVLVPLFMILACGVPRSSEPLRATTSAGSVRAAIPELLGAVDLERLRHTVADLINFGMRWAPISYYTAAEGEQSNGICAARDYLLVNLRRIRDEAPEVEEQPDRVEVFTQQFQIPYGGDERTGDNVILRLKGSAPGRAGVIVVGAHYDTISRTYSGIQPGANDNAVGVAAVLELARLLVQQPVQATYYFVLFSSEEHDRLGSRALAGAMAHSYRVPGAPVDERPLLKAMINLDAMGRPHASPELYRVLSAPPAGSAGRQLARLIERATAVYLEGINAYVDGVLERPGRWADHMSFDELGVPAVRLMQYGVDTANLYHSEDDTFEGVSDGPEDDLSISYVAQVTRAALAAAAVLGETDATQAFDDVNVTLDTVDATPPMSETPATDLTGNEGEAPQ